MATALLLLQQHTNSVQVLAVSGLTAAFSSAALVALLETPLVTPAAHPWQALGMVAGACYIAPRAPLVAAAIAAVVLAACKLYSEAKKGFIATIIPGGGARCENNFEFER